MNQVTLSFTLPTLQAAALCGAYSKIIAEDGAAPAEAPVVESKAPAPKPKAEKPAATAPAPTVATTEPTAPVAEAAAPAEKPKPSIDYPTLFKAITKVAAKDKAAALAVAAHFGADHFKKLDPSTYDEAHAMLEAKFRELTEAAEVA